MTHFFNWLTKTVLRQLTIILVVGFTFLGIQSFIPVNSLLTADAETVKTPEGIYYKGTPNQKELKKDQLGENAQKKFKETTENIREKLNLDQPVPESTKEFLDSTQTKVEKTVEPITGTRHGYYQENIPESPIRNNR
ncbi:hypothetical protein VB711_22575 [Cronbergia sp. UHCC 0137]|uniref:hypothetical protein n=1 Tax=Cronbergia sp. UHCC 0137 TaxID=3110239 RepID=UPI002B1FCE13|nr:hypothetical protein [Cronbergia sp. UHCC 0137]MEA5620603.1 hypothetical protein [Cronbergia sp. UHCC 0137]